jgi:hypothetical protein
MVMEGKVAVCTVVNLHQVQKEFATEVGIGNFGDLNSSFAVYVIQRLEEV